MTIASVKKLGFHFLLESKDKVKFINCTALCLNSKHLKGGLVLCLH